MKFASNSELHMSAQDDQFSSHKTICPSTENVALEKNIFYCFEKKRIIREITKIKKKN